MKLKKMFNKKAAPSAADMPAMELDEELPRRKSGASGFVAIIAVALIIVLLLTAGPTRPTENSSVQQKVLKGSPVTSTISSVITGAGTLAPGDTEIIKLPEIVELDKYYVHNGEKVAPGEVLASVDQVQVLAAIGELSTVLNTLDTDINNISASVESGSISAHVPGKVKAIFAEPGADVAQTVYDKGCLMLLSLDGMMCVTFPSEADASLGDVVDVVMRDGSVETGKVYAVSDGKITVTLSDFKAPYHESVIVNAADGSFLGSGELEIHSPLEISGYYGTVSYVNVKLNQHVGNGTTLITLKDTGHTAKYTSLLNRRNELSEQMDILISMSDGFVRAKEAGIVTNIPADSEYATADEKAEVALTAFTDEFANVRLDWLVGSGDAQLVLLEGEGGGETVSVSGSLMNISESGMVVYVSKTSNYENGNDLVGSTITVSPTEVIINGEPANPQTMGMLSLAIQNQSFPGVSVTFEKAGENYTAKSASITIAANPSAANPNVGNMEQAIRDQMAAMMGGFSFGSFGSFGSGSTQQKSYEAYSTETTDILGLIPMDELTVTIQVDELDILQLHEGMDTTITMDAFQGTTFPGTITRVGNIGQNSGGNTKYAVEVTLSTTEQMLVGMNASVSIVTDTTAPVLTVPAAALQEESGKTWVYTQYDSKKDILSGLTQVTTGSSDGELVEIKSGLDENSTYYYRYADSITYNFIH